jgi:hypothetical protein
LASIFSVAGVLFHALDTAKKVVNATQATVKHVEGEKMECWASMFGVAPPVYGGRMEFSKRACAARISQ